MVGGGIHRLHFHADEMMELDQTLCVLHSLGTVITQVCYLETEKPDYPSLADMGRLVTEKANDVLETIQGPVKSGENASAKGKSETVC